jgi:hypothetical protein
MELQPGKDGYRVSQTRSGCLSKTAGLDPEPKLEKLRRIWIKRGGLFIKILFTIMARDFHGSMVKSGEIVRVMLPVGINGNDMGLPILSASLAWSG